MRWFFLMLIAVGVQASYSQETLEVTPVLLQMIRDDAIHAELDLSDSQSKDVYAAHKSVDPRWFRARNLPVEKRVVEIDSLTNELRQKLSSILKPGQMERVAQLERQALGTRMLTRQDVATALGVSNDKQQMFVSKFLNTDQETAKIQQSLQKNEISSEEAQQKMSALQAAERNLLKNDLSMQQRAKIGTITGQPFDFSKVMRTYPLAPELSDTGAVWIQGGPVKLDELRGKVVAVHYYAFQCINCKRNLPHYKAWFDDYADKGLVVIGIQTPETSAERVEERVREAARANEIEYPVMLDSKSSNWKTWSNTMWPTVYLIDKRGFLRRWWQGEMNWKGTPGEQQMRQTIEQLLAESP